MTFRIQVRTDLSDLTNALADMTEYVERSGGAVVHLPELDHMESGSRYPLSVYYVDNGNAAEPRLAERFASFGIGHDVYETRDYSQAETLTDLRRAATALRIANLPDGWYHTSEFARSPQSCGGSENPRHGCHKGHQYVSGGLVRSPNDERRLLVAAASTSRRSSRRAGTLTIEIGCGELSVYTETGAEVFVPSSRTYVNGATILTPQGEEFGHVSGSDEYVFTLKNIASYEVVNGMVICTLAN